MRYSDLISWDFLEIFRLESSEVWLPGSGLHQFEDLGRRGFLDFQFLSSEILNGFSSGKIILESARVVRPGWFLEVEIFRLGFLQRVFSSEVSCLRMSRAHSDWARC